MVGILELGPTRTQDDDGGGGSCVWASTIAMRPNPFFRECSAKLVGLETLVRCPTAPRLALASSYDF